MSWLRHHLPRPDADQILVCLPHAAGSAAFFRDWAPKLPDLDVHAAQYPGRADRLAEPPPTDLVAMAEGIAASIEPLLRRPVALFGHSMGAVVAFEVARLLAASGGRVNHLFVSGSRAADDPGAAPVGAADRSDEAIMKSLAKLGGTHAELLDDPLLWDLVLPYARADFVLFEHYRYRPGPALTVPVTAINGDADSHVTPDRARRWAGLTTGGFRQHTFPGEHFYLINHPPFALIREHLAAGTPAPGSTTPEAEAAPPLLP